MGTWVKRRIQLLNKKTVFGVAFMFLFRGSVLLRIVFFFGKIPDDLEIYCSPTVPDVADLSLVFICRENPRRSRMLLFANHPVPDGTNLSFQLYRKNSGTRRENRNRSSQTIGNIYDFEFSLVGKIWDGRETIKSRTVWDFPDIWKPGLMETRWIRLFKGMANKATVEKNNKIIITPGWMINNYSPQWKWLDAR